MVLITRPGFKCRCGGSLHRVPTKVRFAGNEASKNLDEIQMNSVPPVVERKLQESRDRQAFPEGLVPEARTAPNFQELYDRILERERASNGKF